MTTHEDLTAGTTAVRIYLLSCGHVVWIAQPVYGEPNYCLSCNRAARAEHYIDEQSVDADDDASVPVTDCPNCGQPAASGHHASENLDACPRWVDGKGWTPRDTAPCSDCGKLVEYISEPWYAIDAGGLCVPCGQARGLNPDEYLVV